MNRDFSIQLYCIDNSHFKASVTQPHANTQSTILFDVEIPSINYMHLETKKQEGDAWVWAITRIQLHTPLDHKLLP